MYLVFILHELLLLAQNECYFLLNCMQSFLDSSLVCSKGFCTSVNLLLYGQLFQVVKHIYKHNRDGL